MKETWTVQWSSDFCGCIRFEGEGAEQAARELYEAMQKTKSFAKKLELIHTTEHTHKIQP